MANGGGGKRRAVLVQAQAFDDLRHWVAHDPRIAARVFELIEAARRDPFSGLGKPEPLRRMGADVWSRRITREDRLVYRVTAAHIDVLQARHHY